MRARFSMLLAPALLLAVSAGHAADYQGAQAALKQFAQAGAPDAQTDTATVLRNELTAFRDRAPSLAPEDAARTWLSYVDRYAGSKEENVVRKWDPLESTCRHASLSIL